MALIAGRAMLEDESVKAVKARFPGVTAALSLGRDMKGKPRPQWIATRRSELFPVPRLRACHADWVAVNRRLAGVAGRFGLLSQCHRAGIEVMVWTVDEDEEMRRWLADERVAVLITNRRAVAVALRASAS